MGYCQSKLGNWQSYNVNTKFGSSPIIFQMDVSHRDHNLLGDFDRIIVRPGVQYFHQPSRSSFLAGYAFYVFQNEGVPNVTLLENRFFQDIDFRHAVARLAIRHRYRFEERFVEASPFAFRIRYAVFVDIPINRKKIGPRTFYLPFWNEIFINVKGSPFDRDRLYGGLGYRFTDGFAIQLGALNQFRTTGPKAQLSLSLHHNLWFGQKEEQPNK